MTSFSIGGATRERVEVEVQGYERNPTGDDHDDNWLTVRVCVAVGAFSGTYSAAFLTDELQSFQVQLAELYRTLSGVAEFSTLEEQLSLQLSGNGRGEILLKGVATDFAGMGNKLLFHLAIDQTYLQTTIQEIQTVIDLFPKRVSLPLN